MLLLTRGYIPSNPIKSHSTIILLWFSNVLSPFPMVFLWFFSSHAAAAQHFGRDGSASPCAEAPRWDTRSGAWVKNADVCSLQIFALINLWMGIIYGFYSD